MKRGWFILLVLLFPLVARAHVGSPNVFFEGQAGPYPVRVIIRPPSVVPGLAEINVRVQGTGVQQVTALPVFWQTGKKGAPPPDVAELVRGETNLYAATLWFMASGAYSIEVEVAGSAGKGAVTVPVNSVATTRRDLPVALGGTLAVLGVFLFFMAVRLAGLAQGEGLLAPGVPLPRKVRIRSWVAMGGALLVYTSAIAGGRYWWNSVDADYRNRLFRATPVEASVREEGEQRILQLDLQDPDERRVTRFIPDHGKMMHLFVVREPDLEVFAHLHPIQRDKRRFEVALPPLPKGTYRAYADVTHESGFSQTMVATVEVPAASTSAAARWSEAMAKEPVCATPLALAPGSKLFLSHDPDDSWHMGMAERGPQTASLAPLTVAKNSLTCPVANGATMVWEQAGPLVENREAALRFKVISKSGDVLRAEAYMGMFGHAAVRRKDGAVFAHLHPMGNISMASQQYFEKRERTARDMVDDQPVHQTGTTELVTFPYEFPQSGPYRIWVQIKSAGRVYTGSFDAEVQPGK